MYIFAMAGQKFICWWNKGWFEEIFLSENPTHISRVKPFMNSEA